LNGAKVEIEIPRGIKPVVSEGLFPFLLRLKLKYHAA
jgi:hypothetical protein